MKMKKISKVLALALAVFTIFSSVPFCAQAKTSPVIYVNDKGYDYAQISWSGDESNLHDSTNIYLEKSADGNIWSSYTDISPYLDTVDITLAPKQALYYRLKFVYSDYEDEFSTATFTSYSNSVFIAPDISEAAYNINMTSYADAYNNHAVLSFNIDSSLAQYVDGFNIYTSVNGGRYGYYKTLSAARPAKYTGMENNYSLTVNFPYRNGYLIKFKIYPYYNSNGKSYQNSGCSEVTASYADDNALSIVTKKDKVVLNIKNMSANYKIEYQPYSIKKRKYLKTKTVWTSSTKYTIKNKAKNNALYITVTPYWGGTPGQSSYAESHSGMALLSGDTKKSKSKKIKVINVRGKKSKTEWTETLTASDKKIIKNFFKKKFKNKKVSRAEKALYAFNWIHSKVKYDYKYSAGSLPYTKAIFKKKKGQCLQYNGAMAKVLTYLGYESRIIYGKRRGNIQHYWCEVKLSGRWYLVETGNEGKNGSWQHFVELYDDGLGYMKNGKDARD